MEVRCELASKGSQYLNSGEETVTEAEGSLKGRGEHGLRAAFRKVGGGHHTCWACGGHFVSVSFKFLSNPVRGELVRVLRGTAPIGHCLSLLRLTHENTRDWAAETADMYFPQLWSGKIGGQHGEVLVRGLFPDSLLTVYSQGGERAICLSLSLSLSLSP